MLSSAKVKIEQSSQKIAQVSHQENKNEERVHLIFTKDKFSMSKNPQSYKNLKEFPRISKSHFSQWKTYFFNFILINNI